MEPTEEMCKSLVKWLQKIVSNKTRSLIEICDGVGILDALIQMDLEYFGKLETKIKRDLSSNNWRLRISNLKKLLEAIIEYYQDVFTLQILESGRPDVVKIGESNNHVELAKLLRLVLGCAINCDKKQQYITMIMEMEENVQQNIMQAIQQLEEITTGPGRSGLSLLIFDNDARIMKLVNDLETANKSKEALIQQIQQLEQQIQTLMDENKEITSQNLTLLEKEAKNPQESYKKQIEQLKEELFRAEVIRDDFKAKLVEQEKDVLGYQEKINELQVAAHDYSRLKDEVDTLTETATKVADLELALASYKKRLENYQDIKRNLQKLEEKNMDYLQKNMELEEELSKSNNWKSQVEVYKNKVLELQQKLDEETQKSDKTQFNLEKLKAKLVSLQGEKERLVLERDSLKEENEELKLGSQKENSSAVAHELIPSDLKEKLRYLEKENRTLRNSNQELELKQAQLENALSHIEKLQLKNRSLNQTVFKLEGQIDEFKTQQGENTSNSAIIKEYRQKVINLQESLAAKENELQVCQAKYNKNVEKAREVAQVLDHLKLFDIESGITRQPIIKDLEEKLFQKLSINSQKETADDRVNNSGEAQGQASLSKQRGSAKNNSQRFKLK